MFDQSKVRALVEPILNANVPAKALREHVLSADGNWADPESTDLFEISFAGIAGIGFGTEDAAEHWIANAITQLSIEELEALA
ncbi:hypothetical protein OAD19_01045 [Octadecabacter sp.]|nr:hypothetical protein [Octadecabacter sp.]